MLLTDCLIDTIVCGLYAMLYCWRVIILVFREDSVGNYVSFCKPLCLVVQQAGITGYFTKHYAEACFTQPSPPRNQENCLLFMYQGKESECGGNLF